MFLVHVSFILTLLTARECSSKCRVSFYNFCDNLSDLESLQNAELISELVIGDENADNEMQDFNIHTINFDTFETLTSLVIVHQIKNLQSFSFQYGSQNLDDLFFFKNSLRRLRENVFDGIKLTKLSLVNNEIEYIHKGLFRNCAIQVIDLSENNLESIERGIFEEEYLGNDTKKLILRHNKLTKIEPKSLPSSLEILNLDYNKLDYMHYDVFRNLDNLKELTVSHNVLTSLPPTSPLTRIELLDFSFNQIKSMQGKEFSDLEHLEIIDLSNNLLSAGCILKSFGGNARSPPLQISLAFNRFTYLDVTNFTLFKDHILSFYGNPWNCQCWNKIEALIVEDRFKRHWCDLEFFNKGIAPYCISFSDDNTSRCEGCRLETKAPYSEGDLDRFVREIEGTRRQFKCSLKLARFSKN